MINQSHFEKLTDILNPLGFSPDELERVYTLLTSVDRLEHHSARLEGKKQLLKSTCFYALKGEHFNGESTVEEKIELLGAAIVSTSFSIQPSEIEKKLIRIPEPYDYLAKIASWFYREPSKKLKLIGITGTNGKTTTAYILDKLYSENYQTAIIGTIGLKVGNELTPLANTTPNALDLNRMLTELLTMKIDVVIMEVSSHALTLGRVDGLDFDQVIFTNFSQEHIDFHHTMDEYFLAKFKIFKILNTSSKPNKKAVIGMDSLAPYWNKLDNSVLDEFNGYEFEKIYLINNINLDNQDVVRYQYQFSNQCHQIELKLKSQSLNLMRNLVLTTNLIGKHNAENISLALLSLYSLMDLAQSKKVSHQQILNDLYIPGRLERFLYHGNQVFVDYAHTPDGLKFALESLKIFHQKIICIFGCGGDRDCGKRALMGAVADELADEIMITNDNPRTEDPNMIAQEILAGIKNDKKVKVELDRKKAIIETLKTAKKSVVLIAGKGHEDYQIIDGKKNYFSDQAVISQLQQIN